MRLIPLALCLAITACNTPSPRDAAVTHATSTGSDQATAATHRLAAVVDQSAWMRQFREAYAAVKASSRGEDAAAFLRDAEAAVTLAPDVPMVRLLAAAAAANSSLNDAAFAHLDALAGSGLQFDISRSPAFSALQQDARFAALSVRFSENGSALGVPDLAFTASGLPGDFVPESITFEPGTGRWLLGSVRHRRVDAVDANGGAFDFSAADSGLLSALGTRLVGDSLFVASAGFPQTAGIAEADTGRSGLFELDAHRGAVKQQWWLPGSGHALGDLLALDGTIYATDSLDGSIVALPPERDGLRTVLAPGLLLSPQGLASLDGKHLVVADYPSGLWRIDPANGAMQRLPHSAALTGIDGLYAHEGRLIAIQNGTHPKRILSIRLDPSHSRVEQVDVLARNLAGWGEPSLGTIHDGALYYIANSQWDRFDAENQLPPADQLEAPRIMRLKL